MLRLPAYGVAVLLAVSLFAGCDSGDDGPSESELFVGTWVVTSVADQEGDKTAAVAALGTLSATLEADGDYVLMFESAQQGVPDQTLGNTYTVNETANLLVLSATNPTGGAPLQLAIEYDFETDDRVSLSVPAIVMAAVATRLEAFGQLRGDVSLTLVRQD